LNLNKGLITQFYQPLTYVYPQVEWATPAISPHLQSFTALWPVFIFPFLWW